jgi:urease alpha subunit
LQNVRADSTSKIEPGVIMRPMFGATSPGSNSLVYVSQAAVAEGVGAQYGLAKAVEGVVNCRNLTKKDIILNDHTSDITVDPETFEVIADGELLRCDPVNKVSYGEKVLFVLEI